MLQKTFRAAIARLVYKYQRTVAEVRQQILFLLNRLRAADDPAGFGLTAAAATAADAAERVPGFLATCQVRWSEMSHAQHRHLALANCHYSHKLNENDRGKYHRCV